MNEAPLIELRAVSCSRSEAGVATCVRGMSLAIRHGTMTVLTGPVGCGKNLVLRLLGITETPDSGEVLFASHPTAQLTEFARAELRSHGCGYLFHPPFLLPAFNVIENIAMPMFKVSRATPEQVKARTESLLEFVGMSRMGDAKQLTLEQQQRVALARALANGASALFVENLDTLLPAEDLPDFRKLLQSAASEMGIAVVATALPSLCTDPAEQRIEIAGGQIACTSLP